MIVLYVAHDLSDSDEMCPGSAVCLSIVEKIEEGLINVQDCDILRESKELPEWLNGTPILVDDNEGVPHKGKDAIKKLRLIASTNPRKVKVSSRSSHTQSIGAPESGSDLNDDFRLDVQQVEDQSSGKVTEQDLQRYMEARNSSPAGQNAKVMQ